MKLRDLSCEGRPAFPPTWQDPYTGSQPLRDEPLGGVLVAVEWGRHNLSLELTNYWRGRRLSGRLLTDDATALPRIHALLSANIPRHVDELVEMELPALAPRSAASSAPTSDSPTETSPDAPSPPDRSPAPALHPDVALLVATLVRKGLLAPEDIEATRRTMAETAMSASASASPPPARPRDPLDADEALGSATVRLIPRK
ncbi:MAG TPA: hypothetical protein VIE44_15630 [Methylomirabilota bacterium]|jgi:hypothetical protein